MNKYCKTLFLIGITLGILSCFRINNIGEIKVKDSKVGFQLEDDGHVTEAQTVPADVDKIYFETFLDIPSTAEIALEFRWYYETQLIYSYTGQHSRGYTIATLEVEPTTASGFPKGEYLVQVWFINTMLDEVAFNLE